MALALRLGPSPLSGVLMILRTSASLMSVMSMNLIPFARYSVIFCSSVTQVPASDGEVTMRDSPASGAEGAALTRQAEPATREKRV